MLATCEDSPCQNSYVTTITTEATAEASAAQASVAGVLAYRFVWQKESMPRPRKQFMINCFLNVVRLC
jgi:hypothetical protein